MKKLSYFFIIVISFFVFHIQFQSYSIYERNQLISYEKTIEDKDNVISVITRLENNSDIKQLLKDVVAFSDENDIISLTGKNMMKDGIEITQKYFYIPDGSISDYFQTIHGKYINPEDKTVYLTTIKNDPDSFDQIDFVDPENHEPYQLYEELYSLSQYPIEEKQPSDINVIFLLKNKDILINQLKESDLAKYIESYEDSVFPVIHEIKEDQSIKTNIRLLTVCCFALVLLYVCQMIKSKKEIMICKMMGYSNYQIIKKLFIKQIFVSIIAYLCIQLLCFAYFVGHFRTVVYPFVEILIMYIIFFIGAMAMIYMVMFFMAYSFHEISNLKKRMRYLFIGKLSLCLKVIMLILIFPPLFTITNEGIEYGKEGYHLLIHKKDLIDNIYIGSFDDRDDKQFDITRAYAVLEKNGAVYNDYSDYLMQKMVNEEMNSDIDLKPYVVVNHNQLNNYSLYDKKGKKINTNAIQEITLFLPEGTKTETDNYYHGNCNVIEIKKGIKYEIEDIHNLCFEKLNDPIIILDPGIPTGGQYYLPKDNYEAVSKDLKQEGMGNVIFFANTSDLYEYRSNLVDNKLISLITIFILYLIVIFIVLYQNLYLYFIDQKKKIAIVYSYGYTWLSRHGDLLYSNLLMYLPVLMYSYFIEKLNILIVLIFIILVMLIEALMTYIMIHHYEIRHSAEILKGGE